MIKYDEHKVEATKDFENALINLMKSQCEMMGQLGDPEYWTWGRCEITELASASGIKFWYGGDDDLPEDDLGTFAVVK